MNHTDPLKAAIEDLRKLRKYPGMDFINRDALIDNAIAALTAAQSAPQDEREQHYDDYAVDCFAELMKEKLRYSREVKGRGGWNDPDQCSVEFLNKLLLEHVEKGDPVDVANLCMMMRHYNANIKVEPQSFDAWAENPYTKVLQKSIAEDYVPKSALSSKQERQEPVATVIAGRLGNRLEWVDFETMKSTIPGTKLYAAPVRQEAKPDDPLAIALNVRHKDCHKAADAFWKYWEENGETHKRGYYESTWGAINAALRTVGVVPHSYGAKASQAEAQQNNSEAAQAVKDHLDSLTVYGKDAQTKEGASDGQGKGERGIK